MPFDPGLAERLESVLMHHFRHIKGFKETRMFGGFGYLLNGNMCFGIHNDTLMLRVGEDMAQKLLKEPDIHKMEFTGRVMKAWITLYSETISEDKDLMKFCELAVDFVKTLPPK